MELLGELRHVAARRVDRKADDAEAEPVPDHEPRALRLDARDRAAMKELKASKVKELDGLGASTAKTLARSIAQHRARKSKTSQQRTAEASQVRRWHGSPGRPPLHTLSNCGAQHPCSARALASHWHDARHSRRATPRRCIARQRD